MTIGQLKRILNNMPNQADVKCLFRFSSYTTANGAEIKGITVNLNGKNADDFSVIMNIEESEEEKAAMLEANAA